MASKANKKRYSVLESDPKVRIGPEAYGAARRRVKTEKAPVAETTCAHRGCGNTAVVYKLREKASETFIAPNAKGEPKGPRFSRKSSDYEGRCTEHSRKPNAAAKSAKAV